MNRLPLLFTLTLLIPVTSLLAQIKTGDLIGAWESGVDEKKIKIVSDQFFSVAVYRNKTFVSTAGGRWRTNGDNIVETYEFHTSQPDLIGKEILTPAELNQQESVLIIGGDQWRKIDDGTPGKLAGAWLITARKQNGQMNKIIPGARRTMKILSGTHFQWIAYNIETKEFFGTGGGTYTTENGQYTENILFFSRDNNRVGATLQFDFLLKDDNWHHKGLSSKG